MHPLPIALLLAASLALGAAAEKKAASTNAPARKPTPNLQPNPRKLNPPPGIVVPAAVRTELAEGAAALGREIEALRGSLRDKPALLALLPDIQIFHNAVRYALEDDIFTSSNQFASARTLLRQGQERAAALKAGQAPWNTKAGLLALKGQLETAAAKKKTSSPLTHMPVVRGYVSRLDGSVQPYGLKVPVSFLQGEDTPRRLDFWLHGRGDTLNEIAFIEGQQRGHSEFLASEAFVLEPYGRFMNAFKFAGEVDVWEALDDAARHFPIDRDRLAMRGFSMGGAGTWHLGAHHPDRFAAVNPGAGFVDVKLYQKLADKPGGLDAIPWYEQKLWNLYDPLACPINLNNTTLVAYSGEIDTQKAAADLMEAALLREGVKMTHIIGPKTGHAYEPNARKTVAGLVDEAVKRGIRHQPPKVNLVSHTLKFNRAHWVTIEALEQHWEPARVEAEFRVDGKDLHITARTRNVAAVEFNLAGVGAGPCRLTLDGQELTAGPGGTPRAVKSGGRWTAGGIPGDTLAKRHNLQGPIDDAFMDSFVMVRPTGEPLNAAVGQWAKTELTEAAFHWRRYFRGEPRLKDDAAVTEDDIRNHHLVLWGDSSSNRLLARIADRLPIRWSGREIRVGTRTFDATRHVPAFIFPNPLNPARYVIINSGFTFPQYAGASNSQQTPKLPDWAVLDVGIPLTERVGGKGVVAADFFGERWEILTR